MSAKIVEIPSNLSVRDLAARVKVSPINIIRELMNNGVMANINQQIDYDTAAIVLQGLGFEPHEEKKQEEVSSEDLSGTLWNRLYAKEDPAKLKARPPVVTVMGHVDHGKTSLLDVIRHTNVVAGEAGGITQHIGAYQVDHDGRKITFLDTPGHEAFTAMRARGAQVTDLAVLVVAADDSVMPQTKEAIAHAHAAHVPIIVALNKIDKPNANPDRVKNDLNTAGVVIDEFGGDVLCVPVSAKKKQGIDDLLEAILLVADSREIKANPDRLAVGAVVEGRLDKALGSVATILVQNGTLKVGDGIIVGNISGRIRTMQDDKGKPIQKALPSTPVLISGLAGVPAAGDTFEAVKDEKTAKAMIASRLSAQAEAAPTVHRVLSLNDLFSRVQAGEVKELPIILKADVQGSIEPIVNQLDKLSNAEVKLKVLHTGTGTIGENDVSLAIASGAIVIGFNVEVDEQGRRLADSEGVDIRKYSIIYKLTDDIQKAINGMLDPVYKEVMLGTAEVRATFKIKNAGVIAGCMVRDGFVQR
ncbi:MAG: translation initiation factor IF-2, partial [Chloroflexi bacterium]|nr:translation initiation factor IF-2 [Chloroflexota bacterium]